jgi:hypothetical protein
MFPVSWVGAVHGPAPARPGLSLRDIASQLVITKGTKKGRHPSPATVQRMLREQDEQTTT